MKGGRMKSTWKSAYRMARMNALCNLFMAHGKVFALSVIECAEWRRKEPIQPAHRFQSWGGYKLGKRLHLGMERGDG